MDFINSSTGYIAGDQGRLYKTTNGGSPIGIEYNFQSVPSDFELFQNFPNPFNPTTTIKYYIPQRSLVQINIYNVLGQKLESILSEIKPQGFHTIEWPTSMENLNSGIYFYELITSSNKNQFSKKRKMVLIK